MSSSLRILILALQASKQDHNNLRYSISRITIRLTHQRLSFSDSSSWPRSPSSLSSTLPTSSSSPPQVSPMVVFWTTSYPITSFISILHLRIFFSPARTPFSTQSWPHSFSYNHLGHCFTSWQRAASLTTLVTEFCEPALNRVFRRLPLELDYLNKQTNLTDPV